MEYWGVGVEEAGTCMLHTMYFELSVTSLLRIFSCYLNLSNLHLAGKEYFIQYKTAKPLIYSFSFVDLLKEGYICFLQNRNKSLC